MAPSANLDFHPFKATTPFFLALASLANIQSLLDLLSPLYGGQLRSLLDLAIIQKLSALVSVALNFLQL